jgi:hypothetical protein
MSGVRRVRVAWLAGGGVFETLADFTFETGQDTMEHGTGDVSDFGGVDRPLIEKSRKQQTEEVDGDPCDGVLRGQVRAVDVIRPALAFIRFQQALGQLGYR